MPRLIEEPKIAIAAQNKPTRIEEFAGREFLDIKPLLEADGWKETARFNVADQSDQIQVSFRRSKGAS